MKKFPVPFQVLHLWINYKSEFLKKKRFNKYGYHVEFEYFIYSKNRSLWEAMFIEPTRELNHTNLGADGMAMLYNIY